MSGYNIEVNGDLVKSVGIENFFSAANLLFLGNETWGVVSVRVAHKPLLGAEQAVNIQLEHPHVFQAGGKHSGFVDFDGVPRSLPSRDSISTQISRFGSLKIHHLE